jgi:hypothetical protein
MRSVTELVSFCISSSGSPIHPRIVARLEIGTKPPTLAREKRLAARHQAGATMAAPASVSVHI